MLRKIKIRILVITILSLVLVLGVIIGTANILNYVDIVKIADNTLDYLAANEGKFPENNTPIPGLQISTPLENIGLGDYKELPYETRFFSVLIAEDKSIKSVDTAKIAAIDDEAATKMAEKVYSYKSERGFMLTYRYIKVNEGEDTRVIFLDCTRMLEICNNFLGGSISISVAGIAAVLAIMILLLDRIMRPVTTGYEKQKHFITDAGHDLKTPITVIAADAEILECEMPDNEWVADIKKQTARLTSLTADLIYLSKMEEEPKLSKSEFPISDILEEEIQSFSSIAKNGNKSFATQIEQGVYLEGEEKSIRRLMSILLDNALKYSPDGDEIAIELTKKMRFASIKISNTAENLSPDTISHMFDRFWRSDSSRSSMGGFGIGLSVAAAIVDAHRGRIFAESKDGRLVINVLMPM